MNVEQRVLPARCSGPSWSDESDGMRVRKNPGPKGSLHRRLKTALWMRSKSLDGHPGFRFFVNFVRPEIARVCPR